MIFRINTYKSCQQHLLVGLSDGDTVFSVLVTEFLIMCTFMQASRDKFEFQLVLWNPFVGTLTAIRFPILVR
jgi:hypothetical protein